MWWSWAAGNIICNKLQCILQQFSINIINTACIHTHTNLLKHKIHSKANSACITINAHSQPNITGKQIMKPPLLENRISNLKLKDIKEATFCDTKSLEDYGTELQSISTVSQLYHVHVWKNFKNFIVSIHTVENRRILSKWWHCCFLCITVWTPSGVLWISDTMQLANLRNTKPKQPTRN